MKNPLSVRGRRGFTLIEMLVVMALLLIVVLLGFPSLLTAIHQAKLYGTAQEIKVLMAQARLEAVRTAPAVVQIVPATGSEPAARVQLFVDDNGNSKLDGTETVAGSVYLPNGVVFEKNDGSLDADSVDGLSTDPDGGANIAIFRHLDGLPLQPGAFHVADQNGNYLEIRTESLGKIVLAKWNGTAYVEQGQGDAAWAWH